MSADKSTGYKDKLMGTIKENIGLTKQTRAEGKIQHEKGEAEIKSAIAKNKVEGGAKQAYGKVTGDTSKEAEGAAIRDTNHFS